MRRLAIIGIVFGVSVAPNAQQRPAFRAGIELVSLSVTVSTPDGKHIGDLSANDFTILEEGRAQEVSFFSRANSALSVSLILDSSASMDAQMAVAQKAATDFVARLRPGDVAEIVDFDSRVQLVQPFTSNRSELEAAIQRISAGGSTALYNALYIALRRFEQLRPPDRDEIRREVIVLLSDGDDTSSLVTFDEVLDFAQRSQTAIYTIGLGLGEATSRNTLLPASSRSAVSLRRLVVDCSLPNREASSPTSITRSRTS